MMTAEAQHMQAAASELLSSSNTITGFESIYERYAHHLTSAQSLLTDLKKRSSEDARYVWWSFVLLCSVCAFIALKRLLILRNIFRVIRLTFGGTVFATRVVTKVVVLVRRVVSEVVAVVTWVVSEVVWVVRWDGEVSEVMGTCGLVNELEGRLRHMCMAG
eukprot:GHVN01027179.1.p1 GENE.GHVN01027179.1~~GHVN01027179.1.p1  ORF type:complete len:161 (-),score=41.48 GHVN01027179.1:114-596(-)